jgi:filamentous hemagglutinin family protein
MLPQGGHFVAGTGSIGTQGITETITQTSQRGIIDFNSFSIGKSGAVKINNGMGATLDRVTGGNLSQIMGTLSATGSVYLVNPQGVVVGKSGVITTGGSFVASSLDISNQNFMAGSTLRFEGKGQSDGMVKNLGSISSSGGDVFLIARSVVNSGSINAPNGTVGLGAGQEVLLKDMSVGGGRMTVRFGKGDVKNKGTIAAAQAELRAAGGNVYALAGNHAGMIRATGSAMRGGHVWLTAGGSVFASGSISASNRDGSGGRVTIKATKLAKVTGRIDASAGSKGKSGGRVIVTGHDVTLGATAVIDARGTGDGGTVLIGGDRQGGANSAQDFAKHTIANAQTTIVEAGAQILADGGAGGRAGSGGNVVIWSDHHTVFAGAISVTGGAQGGDGGFVETSSHGVLAFDGTADRLAPNGKAGTLLLDPEDLDIVATGTSTATQSPTRTFTANVDTSILTVTDLQNALSAGNVIVQTGATPGNQAGNINVNASFSWSTVSSLTLSAFNSITFATGVTATNTGGGSVTLRADNTGIGGVSGVGLNAGFGQVTFAGGKQIKLSGGGATPGNINILYDGFSAGAFTTPINYAGNVTLAAGGNPIGRLIGFNSTFIETCRARQPLPIRKLNAVRSKHRCKNRN